MLIRPWLSVTLLVVIVGVYLRFARGAMPIFHQARTLYAKHWKLFLSIGFVSIPIGIIFDGVQAFMIARQPLKFVVDWFDNTGGARLTAVSMVGGVQQLAMLLIVSPAIVLAVQKILRGEKISPIQAYTGILNRAGTLLLGFAIASFGVVLLLLTAVGFPVAIWLAVKWHFFLQEIVKDSKIKPADAFKKSYGLTNGRWWKTAISLSLFNLLAILPGIAVGFGLLTLGRTAVGFANGISSLLYAVLIPLSVIAVTLLWEERRNNPVEQAVEAESPIAAPNPETGNA